MHGPAGYVGGVVRATIVRATIDRATTGCQQHSIDVLILSGGGFQGLTILKELIKISGTEVFIADIYEENVTKYFTAHYSVFPKISDPSFLSHLDNFVKENKIGLVIPSTAYELEILSKHKAKATYRIAVSSPEIIELFSGKKSSYDYLKKNKFPVLPVFDPSVISEKDLPVIVKSDKGFGGKGISFLKTSAELHLWKEQTENKSDFILQKYLDEFKEFSADFAIDENGAVSDVNLRVRLRQSGGFAVVMENEMDQPVLHSIAAFAKKIAAVRPYRRYAMAAQCCQAAQRCHQLLAP